MNETWQKRVLLAAAAWNVLGAAGALLDPAAHFAPMYGAALDLGHPVQAFFFQVTWIAVIAWGAAYALAAMAPASRLPVLVAGALGKVGYAAACARLLGDGGGTPLLVAAGTVDLVFAGLFAAAALRFADSNSTLRPHAA